MSTPDETRKVKRLAVNIPIVIKIDPSMEKDFTLSQKELEETVVDISAEGMGILSDVYMPEGVLLIVDLDARSICPDRGSENNRINFTSEIMSCRMSGGKYRVGLMIKDMKNEDKEALLKFIESTTK